VSTNASPERTQDAGRFNIEVLTLADRRRKIVARGGSTARYLPTSSGIGHLVYTSNATLFAVPFDLEKLETRGTAIPVLDDMAYNAALRPQVSAALVRARRQVADLEQAASSRTGHGPGTSWREPHRFPIAHRLCRRAFVCDLSQAAAKQAPNRRRRGRRQHPQVRLSFENRGESVGDCVAGERARGP
jgi:hypothetical protein